jgi:hypothetical protein
MSNIKIDTIRREAAVQVIPVRASLIARAFQAKMNLEPALIAVSKYCPEQEEAFKEYVCKFIMDLTDAFLELDGE